MAIATKTARSAAKAQESTTRTMSPFSLYHLTDILVGHAAHCFSCRALRDLFKQFESIVAPDVGGITLTYRKPVSRRSAATKRTTARSRSYKYPP